MQPSCYRTILGLGKLEACVSSLQRTLWQRRWLDFLAMIMVHVGTQKISFQLFIFMGIYVDFLVCCLFGLFEREAMYVVYMFLLL